MRLVTFELATPLGPVRRAGALAGEAIIDLSLARAAALGGRPRAVEIAAAEVPADMLELLRGGDWALEAARAAVEHVEREGVEELAGARVRHAGGDVRLLAPLPRPNSLRDFLVVEEHMQGAVDAGAVKAIPRRVVRAARPLQGQRRHDLRPGRRRSLAALHREARLRARDLRRDRARRLPRRRRGRDAADRRLHDLQRLERA